MGFCRRPYGLHRRRGDVQRDGAASRQGKDVRPGGRRATPPRGFALGHLSHRAKRPSQPVLPPPHRCHREVVEGREIRPPLHQWWKFRGRVQRARGDEGQACEKGVPPSIITLDGKGFRTIHSMENAKQMVGAGPYLIISQRFHNERALYLAKKVGLDAIAFNADNTTSKRWRIQMRIREALARVKAVFE